MCTSTLAYILHFITSSRIILLFWCYRQDLYSEAQQNFNHDEFVASQRIRTRPLATLGYCRFNNGRRQSLLIVTFLSLILEMIFFIALVIVTELICVLSITAVVPYFRTLLLVQTIHLLEISRDKSKRLDIHTVYFPFISIFI